LSFIIENIFILIFFVVLIYWFISSCHPRKKASELSWPSVDKSRLRVDGSKRDETPPLHFGTWRVPVPTRKSGEILSLLMLLMKQRNYILGGDARIYRAPYLGETPGRDAH